ncbi:uncharacterized protein LOC144195895 isoform X2 [Stigmatopora nigra]
MASMQDGPNFAAPPYGKVLLLGVIAAASAFVVTVLIVALCVGCRRKGKTHHVPGEGGKGRLVDGFLRRSKLRSITKSDTHVSKINCNGKSRQLPQIPSEDGEHTYSEVGRSSSAAATRSNDEALYAAVGRAGQTDTPAPPAVPANTPAPPDPDGEAELSPTEAQVAVTATTARPPETTAEYACVRKQRKADKAAAAAALAAAPQKRDSGTDTSEAARHPPPSHPAPPHPHSAKLPRRNVEAFHVPSFPKEVMFMGNGEQYIWKPPEEDELVVVPALRPKVQGPAMSHAVEGIQPSAAAVADMYSKVCKKKRGASGSPPPPPAPSNPGFRTLGRDGGFSVVVKPQTWALREGRPPILAEENRAEPPYAEPDGGGGWRRAAANSCGATLRPRRKKAQQRQPPPPPPMLRHLPAQALPPPGADGLYESIGELERGSGTTTVFTFNDGVEMYVTGL